MTFAEPGQCQCGCGGLAPLATVTHRKAGRVLGQPCRFIHGHNSRIRNPNRRDGPKWIVDPETGCWEWQRARTDNSYGRITVDGKLMQAHRWVYETHVRSLLPNEHVHHKCRNRGCVNPNHLEALDATAHKSHHAQWHADVVALVLESGVSLDELRQLLGVV